MLIGGRWEASRSDRRGPVYNPSTGKIIAEVPFCGAEDVDRAVQAAAAALPEWAETPVVERARVMFRFRELLVAHAEELAHLVTREHGKTLAEARASVHRGVEVIEFACGIPSLIMGQAIQDIARQVDCETIRHPVGVCVGITPFNFPAMVPLWMFPVAITCGNTFVLKPSEKVPLSAVRLGELLMEAGLADGVFNIVHGDSHLRRRTAGAPAGPRRVVCRLDGGGKARVRDGHAERQARSGGGRGEEPPDHHARRRPRPDRRCAPAFGLRLRRRALHGREPRRARGQRRRCAGRTALQPGEPDEGGSDRRRHRGRHGSGHHPRASRAGDAVISRSAARKVRRSLSMAGPSHPRAMAS